MPNTTHVLIVEDEPLIINILITALNEISDSNGCFDFKIKSVTNCDDAKIELDKAIQSTPFDLVLLDINIPSSNDKKMICGEDFGIELKKFFPHVKTIAFTSHNNNYRLNSILKSINPEGFLIKSDIDFAKLLDAIKSVLNDLPYYSKAILQLMRRHMINEFTLDSIDRQLLYQLSKGAKMKHLANITRLSTSAIELRKRNLKELFEVQDGDDRNLLIKAEEHGFL